MFLQEDTGSSIGAGEEQKELRGLVLNRNI